MFFELITCYVLNYCSIGSSIQLWGTFNFVEPSSLQSLQLWGTSDCEECSTLRSLRAWGTFDYKECWNPCETFDSEELSTLFTPTNLRSPSESRAKWRSNSWNDVKALLYGFFNTTYFSNSWRLAQVTSSSSTLFSNVIWKISHDV